MSDITSAEELQAKVAELIQAWSVVKSATRRANTFKRFAESERMCAALSLHQPTRRTWHLDAAATFEAAAKAALEAAD